MLTATGQHNMDSKTLQTFPALLCAALLILVCFVLAAPAQSGRKQRESRSTPVEVTTTPAPPDQPSAAPSRPTFTFIVTKYVQSPTVGVETSIAFSSFVERLSQSRAVEVVPVGKEVTRKEAIDRAKSEARESAYVIWLRIEVDTIDMEMTTAGSPLNPSCLLVSYTVYSPQTGKVKAQGKVYQRGYAPDVCTARMGSPIPRREPMHLPPQYRIKLAGRDGADRVLQAFNLALPPNP